MKVEENDLKLSTKFSEYQSKLISDSESFRQKFKDKNSETIEALLILNHNHLIFKDRMSIVPYLKRQDIILKELMEQFPKANIKELQSELNRLGFWNEQFVVVLFSSISSITLFLFNTIFLNSLSFVELLIIILLETLSFASILYSILTYTTLYPYVEENDNIPEIEVKK